MYYKSKKNLLISLLLLAFNFSVPLYAKTYKVAVIAGLTGPVASVYLYWLGALKHYFEYAKQKNLLGDNNIEIVVRDSQYKSDDAKKHFEEIAPDPNILLLLGLGTGESLALKERIENRKIVTLPGSFDEDITKDSTYIFRVMGSYQMQMMHLLRFISAKSKEHKAKLAFYIHPSAFGRSPIQYAKEAILREKLNIDVVTTVEHNEGMDLTSVLNKFKMLGIEFVINHTIAVPSSNLIKKASELNLVANNFYEPGKIVFLGTHYTGGQALLDLTANKADGFYWVSGLNSPHIDNPGNKLVHEILAANKGDAKWASSSDYISGLITGALTVELFRRAIATYQGVLDRDKILQTLLLMHGKDAYPMPFAVGPIDYGSKDRSGIDAVEVYHLEHAKFQIVH